MRIFFAALLFMSTDLLHGQADAKEIKGVVVKMAVGKSIGLERHQLTFQQDWSEVYVSLAPCAGVNLNGGVGLWFEKFDFELLLDQSFTGIRFYKTNILATGYLKIPARTALQSFHELESFRWGLVPV